MLIRILILLAAVFAGPLAAQLTPDQRELDFRTMASLYAKRYAPAQWKLQVFNFDLLNISPWLTRVRQAKDDLEYFEICAEYVANLDDLHSSFRVPSNFVATLDFAIDLYEGRALIEQINRLELPEDQFPFQVGDEVVSVDGRTPDELITAFSRFSRRGNTQTTRRSAADLITFRAQRVIPRANELGESASVVIRRDTGETQTFTIRWRKIGVPFTAAGPVAGFKSSGAPAAFSADEPAAEPAYKRPLRELQNWSVPADDPLLQGQTWSAETGEDLPRRYLLGWGSRNPVYNLPSDFVVRRGRAPADFHYSGTYASDGLRIGYIRIPNFAPQNQLGAIRELEEEVAFMEQNTDGMVVDVARNTGGGCYMLDVARRLIPTSFYFFGEEIRVTWERIVLFENVLELARRQQAEEWIINAYTAYLDEMKSAYTAGRPRTRPIPSCSAGAGQPPVYDNTPAAGAYTKPLIVLIDEFSTSAGDIFPAMMQDNRRGPLVGARTNGAGGSTSLWNAGYFSEATTSNTNSLVVRREPIATPDYPVTNFIENVGARPDVALNFMTRDNLMTRGRPYVEGFTAIVVQHIRASAP